ncbi:MAG: PAS domain-containing protein [Pseudomonadota bacterium]|nr:PAS domain-containing protein [Pseudomonadota bacterium]
MRQLDGAGFVVDLDEPTTDWIETYIPADERPRVEEAIEGAIWTKDVFELEHRVLRVDGTVGWTFSRAIPLLDDAGEIVEWFGVASDVTARVKADQSFTRLFEASPAPFLVLAPDPPRFTITEVNDAYLTATMRTRADLVGRPLFDAFPDNPNEPTITGASRLRDSLERVLASRQPDKLPGLKYDIARPDGTFEERWWSPVNSPILDEKGEVEAIIHNANDVTEERLADLMLRESEQRQGLLLAELQHRVRNILAMIQSVVRRTLATSESAEEYASHLRGRIAAMARTQAVLTRNANRQVDLEEAIREELLSVIAPEEQFWCEGPDVALPPRAAEILTLSIHELATNSVKYGAFSGPEGQVEIRWTVEARDKQQWLPPTRTRRAP